MNNNNSKKLTINDLLKDKHQPIFLEIRQEFPIAAKTELTRDEIDNGMLVGFYHYDGYKITDKTEDDDFSLDMKVSRFYWIDDSDFENDINLVIFLE